MVNQLSVFLPFYNEEPLVTNTIRETFKIVEALGLERYEVLAVENGSTDNTLEELKKFGAKYPNLRVMHLEQAGYGRALKAGFENAQYEWVFFADSDLQIDLNNLPRFIEHADPLNMPMVIGYRTNTADGWHRWLNRQLIRVANRVLFGVKAKDIDCAFKLIHRSVLKKVMPLESDGAIISTELLAKATKAKVPMVELPVKHLPDPEGGSTGANFKVLFKAGVELLQLWRKI